MDVVRQHFLLLFSLLLFLLSAACGTLNRSPVSPEQLSDIQIPGIPRARYWADTPPENLDQLISEAYQQRRLSGVGLASRQVLVMSGGAEQGAYGAGLLKAWSEMGTRPQFTTVTGVSTGALIAPFAFLGSDYDAFLAKFYGGTPANEIFRSKGVGGLLFGVSVADNSPLQKIIEDTVTPAFMAEIAKEHRKGRRLLIQSLSLDAQRPVIWDLGAIAASGAPNAEQVFQDALLASASIPGAFPPVLVQVQTPDGIRDEMHVDGAISASATGLEGWYLADPRRELPVQAETLYVVRNFRVLPEPEQTKGKLLSIAARSLDTLVKTQGTDDLLEIYLGAKDIGSRYRVTWIGAGFTETPPAPFDQDYMQALYEYGYQKMKSGNAWSNLPPQLLARDKVANIH